MTTSCWHSNIHKHFIIHVYIYEILAVPIFKGQNARNWTQYLNAVHTFESCEDYIYTTSNIQVAFKFPNLFIQVAFRKLRVGKLKKIGAVESWISHFLEVKLPSYPAAQHIHLT